MKNAVFIVTMMLLSANTLHAQTNKTQQQQTQSDWDDNDTEKPVRFNVVLDDPMEKFGPQTGQKDFVTVYTVPDFYFPGKKKVKDTTYNFLCYDFRDTLIEDVRNFDLVHYYSMYKEYNDPVHTYNDNGVKKPLPVSSIVKRYDQIAKEKWMSVEYPGNKYVELKGNRNIVVRSDTTTVIDPLNGSRSSLIYRYYKVTKN